MKTFRWGCFLGFLLCLMVSNSAAQTFYVTSEPGKQLDRVDFTAGTVTNIFSIGSEPDSLVVNAQGQLFYTVTPLGTLQMFDPATGQDTVLASFGNVFPRDLTFDPDGKSILVSLYGVGKLGRYNLATGTFTIFPSQPIGQTLDGLAYDPAGNLYAVVSRNTLCQLDPVTGSILQTVVLEPHSNNNGGDGLVYDSFTKNLWLTRVSTLGSGLIEIPLTQSTPPVLGAPIFFQTGNIVTPDGVISDGLGNLYIGEALQHLTEYNIPTDTIVKRLLSPGIDGLAFDPSGTPAGQFSIALTPASITALDNETVSYTLNIATTENPAPTFQISCTGLPSPAVCTTPGSAAAGNSQIQVETQSLPAGGHPFSVSVTDGVTSKTVSGQITIGNFAALLSSSNVTIAVGQSGTVGVSVTGDNGFSDPVNLSCSSPAGTTCIFTPASVNPSATGTPSTLTISVATRPGSSSKAGGLFAILIPWTSLALGILIFPIRAKPRRGPGAIALAGLLCLSFALSCGGNKSDPAPGPIPPGSTPTTFTVSVQATSDNIVENAGTVLVTIP